MLQKYTTSSAANVRWHDSSVGPLGPGSIVETEHTNIVVVGGVDYIAAGSSVNVLVNTGGSHSGLAVIPFDLASNKI
jgi:hypothetical protein